MAKPSSPQRRGTPPERGVPRNLLGLIGAGLRKTPTTFVLVLIGLFIYFRGTDEPAEPEPAEVEQAAADEEPQPPPDLPASVSPEMWTCVYRTDKQLSAGRWADVYHGLEASDFGRAVIVTVSEAWAELTDSQRTSLVEVVGEAWRTTGREVALFTADAGLEKLTLKRAADDTAVAVWTPRAGVELLDAAQMSASGTTS